MLRSRIRLPIMYQVLAGNAIVILIGALGGTYITQQLIQVSGIELALAFAAAGICLSLSINYFILRRAFSSISILQQTIERIDRGDTHVRASVDEIDDPQLQHFAQALNTMLARLDAHMRLTEANRAQLRRLSHQVLTAQEEERKRIARELHDDTSGSLARILLNIDMVSTLLPTGWGDIAAKIRATRVLCEQTLDNVRKLIFDLRPTLLDDLGLVPAVRWYAKNHLEPAGIAVQFNIGEQPRATPLIETALYRIAQEAVSNILRHAHAKHVNIQLGCTATHWMLVVQDDGCGFDPRTLAADQRWGLVGVEERAALMDGTCHIDSASGQGTTLRVEIPLGKA